MDASPDYTADPGPDAASAAATDSGTTKFPEAVIFDVDGTLADVASIRHYVTGDERNFHKFHAAASLVHPHHEVVDLATSLKSAGYTIIIVTSRKE